MTTQRENRFLAIGIVLGIVGSVTTGATLKHRNETGRFLLKTGETDRAYVIDTMTGQVWDRGGKADHRKIFYAPKAESRLP